jgi:hypothetical protein
LGRINPILGTQPISTPARAHRAASGDNYPLGVRVSDQELAAVAPRRHDWHGEWNYTLLPAAA